MTTTASGAQFGTEPLLKDDKNWNLLLTAYTKMWRHQMRYFKNHLGVKEVKSAMCTRGSSMAGLASLSSNICRPCIYLYYTHMWQVRILAYGKGALLVDSFSGAATAAGIRVVKASCPHFAANMFSRANYLPEDALVGQPTAVS